jgi:hypothetical protein
VRRLEPLTPEFAKTRAGLHRAAAELLAPARKPDNEIALLAIAGGFGTPVFSFGDQFVQVRVERDNLWTGRNGVEQHERLTSIAAGAELIGTDLFPEGVPDDPTPLDVDGAAAEQLGRWFSFGREVLEHLREEWRDDDPTEALLWPEHFDVAIEAGSESDDKRATYGFSPGDLAHEQPYLYVAPWSAKVTSELWQARGFRGAEIRYAELLEVEDQFETALEFCRVHKQALDDL